MKKTMTTIAAFSLFLAASMAQADEFDNAIFNPAELCGVATVKKISNQSDHFGVHRGSLECEINNQLFTVNYVATSGERLSAEIHFPTTEIARWVFNISGEPIEKICASIKGEFKYVISSLSSQTIQCAGTAKAVFTVNLKLDENKPVMFFDMTGTKSKIASAQ